MLNWLPAIQIFHQLTTFGAPWNGKYSKEDPGLLCSYHTTIRQHSSARSPADALLSSQMFKDIWELPQLTHLTCFLCLILNKIQVYGIYISLHSVFICSLKSISTFLDVVINIILDSNSYPIQDCREFKFTWQRTAAYFCLSQKCVTRSLHSKPEHRETL